MRRAPLRKMLGLVLVSVCAKVAAAAEPPTERVAVVFVGQDSKDPAAVAFTQALFNLGDRSPQLTLISEKSLTKSLKADPVKLFTKCGTRLACITKLSRKAKAKAVLFGKWGRSEDNGPLTLQYLLITVQSRKIRQKGVMTLAAGIDATHAASDNFQAMLGIQPPAPLPSPQAAPAEPAAPPTGETAVPPSPAAPQAPVTSAAPSSPEGTVPTSPPAAAPSTATPLQNVSAVAPRPTPALFITSLAVMGVGVVTLGTGAALVLDAHHQADGVDTNAATGMSPAQALSTINSANSKIRTGNLLMEVGGGVTAVGGVLLLLDRLNVFGTNADSHVAWHVDPGAGAFAWSWKQAF